MFESYVYFPQVSVDWTQFNKGDGTRTHPDLDEGVFWDISVAATAARDSVWSYPKPRPGHQHLKDYVAQAYGVTNLRTQPSG